MATFKKVFAAMNLLYGGIKEEECKSNQDDDSDIDFEKLLEILWGFGSII